MLSRELCEEFSLRAEKMHNSLIQCSVDLIVQKAWRFHHKFSMPVLIKILYWSVSVAWLAGVTFTVIHCLELRKTTCCGFWTDVVTIVRVICKEINLSVTLLTQP